MPTNMFPINLSTLPFVATRKALLIIDLQNDFISPDGALPVEKPEAFVPRTLELAKAFRDSGAGEVIWIRTEFERHCPLQPDGDQIIVTDIPIRRIPARGRRPASTAHDSAVLEGDDEAFLSLSVTVEKPLCVRKDTSGAELAPTVQEAVVEGRDTVFTKTHYSAFASEQQQLVQMLRGRFVTEMYICGALTNVSIYATALDAGKHGHEITIVDDCCGFRNELRHMTALRQLTELTGCEVLDSEDVIAKLPPPKKKQTMTPPSKDSGSDKERIGRGSTGPKESRTDVGGAEREAATRPLAPPSPQSRSTGLSPAISKISLSLGGPSPSSLFPPPSEERAETTAEPTPTQPRGPQKPPQPQPTQPSVAIAAAGNEPKTRRQSDVNPVHMDAPLEARDSGGSSEEEVDEGESLRAIHKRLVAARSARQAAQRSEATNRAVNQPRPSPRRPSASTNAEAEQTQTRIKTRQPLKPASPEEKSPPKSNEPRAKPSASTEKTLPKPEKEHQPSVASKAEPSSMAEPQQASAPTFSEPMCEGDTAIISNVLPPILASSAFDGLLREVSWASMSHLGGEVPRRIAVQGAVDDEGNMPVYRHPSDESPPLLPFSPTVLAIKTEIEKHLGHPLNHVLIQHYRSGNDYISEHSDKTLDIVRGSFIANVSLGAERTMLFRTKRPRKEKDATPTKKPAADSEEESSPSKAQPRQTQRAPLPHNSLCRMGLETNMRWLHAIRQDKRSDRDKTAAELAQGGARISLTFRQIGTFLDPTLTKIWGQGAVAKTKESAGSVVNGQTPEAIRMLQAFGTENNSSDFDWDAMYGNGFDVLHMGSPKRFCTGGKDPLANTRVALALAELGISCAKGNVEGDVRFEDNDVGRAVIDGHETVLRYLDAVYGAGRRYDQLVGTEVAKRFVRLQRGLDLLGKWRAAQEDSKAKEEDKKSGGLIGWAKKELAEWEKYAGEAAACNTTDGGEATATEAAIYIAGGPQPSPADFAFWPVLHDIVGECGEGVFVGEHLKKYYQAFRKRSAVEKALGPKAVDG